MPFLLPTHYLIFTNLLAAYHLDDKIAPHFLTVIIFFVLNLGATFWLLHLVHFPTIYYLSLNHFEISYLNSLVLLAPLILQLRPLYMMVISYLIFALASLVMTSPPRPAFS